MGGGAPYKKNGGKKKNKKKYSYPEGLKGPPGAPCIRVNTILIICFPSNKWL